MFRWNQLPCGVLQRCSVIYYRGSSHFLFPVPCLRQYENISRFGPGSESQQFSSGLSRNLEELPENKKASSVDPGLEDWYHEDDVSAIVDEIDTSPPCGLYRKSGDTRSESDVGNLSAPLKAASIKSWRAEGWSASLPDGTVVFTSTRHSDQEIRTTLQLTLEFWTSLACRQDSLPLSPELCGGRKSLHGIQIVRYAMNCERGSRNFTLTPFQCRQRAWFLHDECLVQYASAARECRG